MGQVRPHQHFGNEYHRIQCKVWWTYPLLEFSAPRTPWIPGSRPTGVRSRPLRSRVGKVRSHSSCLHPMDKIHDQMGQVRPHQHFGNEYHWIQCKVWWTYPLLEFSAPRTPWIPGSGSTGVRSIPSKSRVGQTDLIQVVSTLWTKSRIFRILRYPAKTAKNRQNHPYKKHHRDFIFANFQKPFCTLVDHCQDYLQCK